MVLEPRRECQQIVMVYPNGEYRVCGCHVHEVPENPAIVKCHVCGSHSLYRDTVSPEYEKRP